MADEPFQWRCVLCHDYGDRDEADRADLTIIENVQQHGCHVVMVPEDEIGPGFAYTIGLAHTHGAPELAVFGLDVQVMHRMVNRLGAKSAAGAVLAEGQRHPDVVDGHRVAPGQVDLRWYRTLFGRAIGFYRLPPLPVLQVARPDVDHLRALGIKQGQERLGPGQGQLPSGLDGLSRHRLSGPEDRATCRCRADGRRRRPLRWGNRPTRSTSASPASRSWSRAADRGGRRREQR
ncbi:DUF4262 domain-containing protein [Streptomyces sp. Wb2n-11]|uniref:DUF4262 domain-containing protein n=1 Tax=Streptomyces sp. Wb2n-11 TaxID=1030533 RepID=UPI000A9F3E24|nr:DUF4262 domain-containing protein [Streptomyces sp. Wb2n-11]